jgi:hypothetical protein
MLHGSFRKSKSKSPKWVFALRYITVAPQTDPIKYGISRLTNDVIINNTLYFEVKFYPVKVNLAQTTSCTCIHRRRLIRARGARAPQYLGQGAHAIDEPPIIKTKFSKFITYITGKTRPSDFA